MKIEVYDIKNNSFVYQESLIHNIIIEYYIIIF